ncbi:MAG: aspartate kinase [Bacteroidales bacterium]|jgi:aspartate kinase|nr:aspartate kinase [Bacteroidales bacterium]
MLTVEKIGGTSMSKFHDVLRNIVTGNRTPDRMYNRIFVVSAYSNVTNWLLEHKKSGQPGIYTKFYHNEDYETALDELCTRLIELNHRFENIKLSQAEADQFIKKRIAQARHYLNSMAKVVASGYVNKNDLYLAAREILASIGEAHSAYNSVNILNNNGINATFVDLCGFYDSEPLTIDERIKKVFHNIDFSKTLCVATGYTKGTEGIMRAFDRGYSEVTFSKIAVEVKADEAIIHKEYHLSSADPNIVGEDKCVPVGHTSFIIADQLADIGMEAIHPKAAKPLEMNGINIRIKNTFEPEHEGTLITRGYVSPTSKVEIVSGTDKVTAIEIYDPMMVGEVGFDMKIMEIFAQHEISYILKSTNANCITMVVWDSPAAETLAAELSSRYEEVRVEPVAMVCCMGTNIAIPGMLGRAANALHDRCINIEAFSQSLRQVNMQFVISRERYRDAITALNEALCLGPEMGVCRIRT